MQDRANRIMLEATQHEKTSFVTLTYSDENLPSDCSLSPDDLKYFIMRLRSNIYPLRIRYFACGEYGGQRFGSKLAKRDINPHYHLALYGLDYTDSDVIQKSWSLGHTDTKFLEPASALYLAKYVTKKMTGKQDERLVITEDWNLHPEFQRMSLKPGLGATAIQKYSKIYDNPYALAQLDQTGDVPHEINLNGKSIPLGRYLKTKLREALGFENIQAQTGWEEKKLIMQMCTQKEQEEKILKSSENKNLNSLELAFKTADYAKSVRNMKRSRIIERLNNKQIKEIL